MAAAQQNAFTFKYSNKSYNIVVTLYTETGNPKDDISRSLDMNFIDEVMYESELNDLVFYGHVIYTDKYAFIDQFKSFQYRYCRITFATNKQKTDGDRGMTNEQIIAQLGSLIEDAKSRRHSDGRLDEVFENDIEALTVAIHTLKEAER